MKKNGFTLIELLAVIVILAIIALIATPIIVGIINDAREQSEERSVELYASAVRNAIASYQLTGTNAPTSFGDLNVEKDGDINCAKEILYEDGSFYLGGCTVNGGDKEYTYGIEKACTRQNDENGFDTVTCTIGETPESFYVMNSYLTDVPSDKIVMMTKYNIDPTTKKQSSTAGTVVFSSTNYWSSETSYPADVYNNNSLLYPIVEEYVSYLNTKLTGATGSLLTYSQAQNLGCSGSDYSCSSAPTWVYSTFYWTGYASDTNFVCYVQPGGYFNCDYGHDYGYGIRPVITISTSNIG